MEHHFEHTPFEGKREQTERALLQKFVLLYATLGRDAGSAQHTTPDGLGKTILEAARDKDELSLKVKLLDSWAIMIANGSGIEVPKGKVQSLSRLLASLTDLEKAAEHMIPTLKSLSLRSDEFAKTMAEKYMSEIAVKVFGKLQDIVGHMQDSQSFWSALPTEIWLSVFSFLSIWDLQYARRVYRFWCDISNGFLQLRFPYHGYDQNAVQFLQLAPTRLPLKILSNWYSLELHKDQLDANLSRPENT